MCIGDVGLYFWRFSSPENANASWIFYRARMETYSVVARTDLDMGFLHHYQQYHPAAFPSCLPLFPSFFSSPPFKNCSLMTDFSASVDIPEHHPSIHPHIIEVVTQSFPLLFVQIYFRFHFPSFPSRNSYLKSGYTVDLGTKMYRKLGMVGCDVSSRRGHVPMTEG